MIKSNKAIIIYMIILVVLVSGCGIFGNDGGKEDNTIMINSEIIDAIEKGSVIETLDMEIVDGGRGDEGDQKKKKSKPLILDLSTENEGDYIEALFIESFNSNLENPEADLSFTDEHKIIEHLGGTKDNKPIYTVSKRTENDSPILLGITKLNPGDSCRVNIWVKGDKDNSHIRLALQDKSKKNLIESKVASDNEWNELTIRYENNTDEVMEGIKIYLYTLTGEGDVTEFHF